MGSVLPKGNPGPATGYCLVWLNLKPFTTNVWLASKVFSKTVHFTEANLIIFGLSLHFNGLFQSINSDNNKNPLKLPETCLRYLADTQSFNNFNLTKLAFQELLWHVKHKPDLVDRPRANSIHALYTAVSPCPYIDTHQHSLYFICFTASI